MLALYIVSKQIPQLSQARLIIDIINTWVVCFLPSFPIYFMQGNVDNGFIRFFTSVVFYLLLESLLVIRFVLTKNERTFLYRKITRILKN